MAINEKQDAEYVCTWVEPRLPVSRQDFSLAPTMMPNAATINAPTSKAMSETEAVRQYRGRCDGGVHDDDSLSTRLGGKAPRIRCICTT